DFLAAGQTLTQTYTVKVADNSGGFTTQDVTITITGTDDVFLITGTVTLSGDTLPYPLIENDGTIATSSNNPSTLLGSIITGAGKSGTINIVNNTTLEIDGSVDSGQTVIFSRDVGGGAVTELKLKDPSEFLAKISDFNGRDQFDLLGFQLTAPASWNPNPNNIGGTLTLTGTLNGTTVPDQKITFVDGTYVLGQTLKVGSDGSGGTLITDPPASTTTAEASTTTTDASTTTTDVSIATDAATTITTTDALTTTTDASTTTTDASIATTDAATTITAATVTPVAKTSTLTATKMTSRQTKATSATVTETASSRTNATLAAAAADEGIMVALNTAVAVAVALDTAVADPDSSKTSSLTISRNDTAVDITGTVSGSDSSIVDSGAALKLSPVSLGMAGTLTENGTIEAINGKPADAVSETGAFKIDAGAALQLDGSDAVSAPVITDGTNTDAINSPGNHATKTAWHGSDDGRGGKTAHDAPGSETGEDPSAQSTSADNHFGALPSDPSTLTALPSNPSGAHGPAARALAPGDDTPVQSAPANNGHH